MKEIFSVPLGGDGGKLQLDVASGNLELKATFPVAKILEPLKVNFVDKLKASIPGPYDDMIIDKLWEAAVAELSEVPAV